MIPGMTDVTNSAPLKFGDSGPISSGPLYNTQGDTRWKTGGLTIVKTDAWVWIGLALVALIVFLIMRKKK